MRKSFKKYILPTLIAFSVGFISQPSIKKYCKNSDFCINLYNIKKKILYTKNILINNFRVPSYISDCEIESRLIVPKDSLIVIGHAYGSHKASNLRSNKNISPSIIDFYSKNKNNIRNIIFSGDVLKVPSIKKWNNFYSNFDESTGIYIAPGNHDIGTNEDNAFLDIFKIVNQQKQSNINYPFYFSYQQSLFIINNSIKMGNSFKKIKSIINENKSAKNIFVVTHNVLPKILKVHANSESKYPYIEDNKFLDLGKEFKNKNINFIYGDGGAFSYKKRLVCKKIGNTLHVVNGIGDKEDDLILIVNKGTIYKKNIYEKNF